MTEYIAVSREKFDGKSWRRFDDYRFAAGFNVLPVVQTELARVVPQLPLAFVRAGEQFQLVALTSLQSGDNWLVDDEGTWLGNYVPATLRGYPFKLIQAQGRDELVLCFNPQSDLLLDGPGGEPFFAADGQPAKPLAEVLNFLQQVENDRRLTQQAVLALAAAELIQPWPINIKQGEREVPVSGLFRIDEARLQGLRDEQWLDLRRAGALPLLYGQLFSQNQLPNLALAREARERRRQAAPPHNPTPQAIFDTDGDFLKFS